MCLSEYNCWLLSYLLSLSVVEWLEVAIMALFIYLLCHPNQGLSGSRQPARIPNGWSGPSGLWDMVSYLFDISSDNVIPNLTAWWAISGLILGFSNIAVGTRLDIIFAITFLSQFLQNPDCPHWEEAKHVFCYSKGMIGWKHVIGTGGIRDGLSEENKTKWVLRASQPQTNTLSQVISSPSMMELFLGARRNNLSLLYLRPKPNSRHARSEGGAMVFLSEVTCPLTTPSPSIALQRTSTLEKSVSIFNITSSAMCPSANYSPSILRHAYQGPTCTAIDTPVSLVWRGSGWHVTVGTIYSRQIR